ncbi:MAG: hypothetical protein UZ04_CHB001000416 [Chlorobi bacterium OLB4]|jgi:hypothetical protein|nr:MAG: hypothetical protein UZ04_CHB001000416 [Chlorobi bacterium OLB4]MBW7854695.1 hypothetical protein [Ignavibacteria bacterium]OQY78216.1 MAG: hypothetical protein B6D43_03640 [Ignavibacteriales bacterium UTCHB1]
MKAVLIGIFILFPLPGISKICDIPVTVFNSNHISFGDSLDQGEVKVLDKGRIIHRKITLPEKNSNRKITAILRIASAGDPWDRFGSIFIAGDNAPDVELTRFMTGFGTGRKDVEVHPTVKNWADYSEWEIDVSMLDVLLQGEVIIGAMIDTWVNPGWTISFSLIFSEDETAINPFAIIPLINTIGEYKGIKFFNEQMLESEFNLEEKFTEARLIIYTSGHGGTSLGDEFHPKHNVVYLDGKEIFRFIPWRSDCTQFRPFNPTSAKWEGDVWSSDLDRSGWCPGDIVDSYQINLTGLNSGNHKLAYNVENQSSLDMNFWNIDCYLAVWR